MNSKSKKYESVGQEIMEALTKEQVAQLLGSIFNLWDEEKINQLLSTLDEDVSATLSQILSPATDTQESAERIASDEKYVEEWDALWDEWQDIAFEVGDEDGRYVTQDYDWEAPYFCHYEVSNDLEKVAQKMLPLIDKIYPLDFNDDNIIEEMLKDIPDSVRYLPEWLGAEDDSCAFGPATTRCLLQWEWLAARAKNQNAISFTKRIIEIDDALTIFYLDDEAVIDFFQSLPEDARRDIYEDMTSNSNDPLWQKCLASSRSKWYRIYHAFSEPFNPQRFLQNCRDLIDEDWRYGLPLLKHLIEKQDYAEAEKIVQQTFASYLSHRRDKEWKPEESLFINYHVSYTSYTPDNEIIQLLTHWLSIAEGLGQAERTTALKLQLITYKKPFEWDDVTGAFKEVNELPFTNMTERLFQQWQLFILNQSIWGSIKNAEEGKDTWIFWLLETGLDDSKDKTWFADKVNQWLESLLQNPTQFKEQHGLVYTLTKDLAQNSSLKEEYPSLFEIVLDHVYSGSETKVSRRAWLERMNGQQFIPLLMECWKRNVGVLVPDPANAYKSRYNEHARWLVVVKELNPAIYQDIINQWKIDHHRRKNLWAALSELKLPF